MEAKIIPATALRPQLLRRLKRAERLGEECVVTRNGKPAAVIVGYDEWESWRETKEILADRSALRRIRRSRAYFARGGKGKTLAQIFRK